MVGFQDQRTRLADAFDHQPGGVAEIGEETDIAERVIEHEPDRIVGVVRNGKTVDPEVAQLDRGARFKEPPGGEGRHLGLEIFRGEPVAIDRNGVALGQHRQTANVVAVFVGEKNGLHIGDGPADRSEPRFDLPGAEPGIDEKTGMLGLEIGAVAAAAAAQNGEMQHGILWVFSPGKASREMVPERVHLEQRKIALKVSEPL
jgi:hypothetical protein